MPNEEVLHPFSQQNVIWDSLWLEQDGGAHLRVFARRLINKQVSEANKAAVNEVCSFIMNLKRNTRLFQHRFDWRNPSPRVKTVLDKASRAAAAYVASTPARKQSKQQRRSSVGIDAKTQTAHRYCS